MNFTVKNSSLKIVQAVKTHPVYSVSIAEDKERYR